MGGGLSSSDNKLNSTAAVRESLQSQKETQIFSSVTVASVKAVDGCEWCEHTVPYCTEFKKIQLEL